MNHVFNLPNSKQTKFNNRIIKYKKYLLASTLLISTTLLINNSVKAQQNNETPKNEMSINKMQTINEHEKYILEQQRKGFVRIYGPLPDNKNVEQVKTEMEELRNNQFRRFITNVDKTIENTISKTLNNVIALFNYVLYSTGKFIFYIGIIIFGFVLLEPVIRFFKEHAKRFK
ncbi:MAG: hypothetical protein QXF76_00465 [Candidatus Anstonellales archaeon]